MRHIISAIYDMPKQMRRMALWQISGRLVPVKFHDEKGFGPEIHRRVKKMS